MVETKVIDTVAGRILVQPGRSGGSWLHQRTVDEEKLQQIIGLVFKISGWCGTYGSIPRRNQRTWFPDGVPRWFVNGLGAM
jgi:hypothetical protein